MVHGIQKQSTGYPFCHTSSETQICTGKYDFADSGREDVEKKEGNMKRKKIEGFILAAVAGSFVVSMTGPQDIWALGNNGGRSYKVQTIQDSSTGKTALSTYISGLSAPSWARPAA